MTEASGKGRSAGPWVPSTVPSARTTPAAAVGTGQFSIDARLFNDMASSLSASRGDPGKGAAGLPRATGRILTDLACLECTPGF
ncbi:hypothetical protein GCM10009535_18320 [Streptomyces thermocarboxydovorans]|uniref:Uncharacterized protein n=1 Tax=Streptomyces thermocarboxydovorans TaxID=59298 RepID=A0ABP3SIH0_9ACTN